MDCSNCHTETADNARFCSNCGARLAPPDSGREPFHHSEKRFRSYFELAPHGMFITDETGCFLEVNPVGCRILGYAAHELVGRSFLQALPDDAMHEAVARFSDLRSQGAYSAEVELIDKDGNRGWWNVEAVKITDSCFMGIVSDLTSRKLAEEALRESKTRYKQLVDNAPYCIHELDHEGRFLSINPAGLRLVDMESEVSIIGKSYRELVHESDRPRVDALFQETLLGKASEFEFFSAQGKYFRSNFVPLNNGRVIGISVDMTDQRRQAEELRSSEANFRALFEQAAVGMLTGSSPSKITRVNPKLCSMLGYTAEELLRLSPADFTHPDDLAKDLELFGKLVAGEVAQYHLEKRYLRKDGSVMWGQLTLTARRENDQVAELIGIVQEIDARKAAEEALRESEERFRQMAESIHAVFWITGPAIDQLEYVSQAFECVWGWTVAELLDSPSLWLETIVPEDRERVSTAFSQLGDTRQVESVYRIRRKDGAVRIIRDRGFTICDSSGRVVRRVGIAEDVTDLKTLETKLKESEHALRVVLEGTTDGILVADVETRKIVFANQAICRLLDYSIDQLSNMTIDQIHPGDSLEEVLRLFEAFAHGEITVVRDVTLLLKNGSVRTVDISGSYVTLQGRRCNVGVFHDTTDRKQQADKLRESEERYRRAELGTKDGLWEWDITTGTAYYSPRWQEMLGYHDGDLTNTLDAAGKLIHPDHEQQAWHVVEQHLAGNCPFDLELQLRRKDNSYLWVRSRGEAERDSTGKPIRMTGTIADISSQKKVEAELIAERNFSKAVIDNAGALVVVLDRDGRICRFNRAAEQLSGYTFEDLQGKAIWETLLPPEEKDAIRELAFESHLRLSQSQACTFSNEWITRDGKRRAIEWCNTVVLDTSGKMEYMVSIGNDVTERLAMKSREVAYVNRLKQLSELSLLLAGDPSFVFERMVRMIGELFDVKVVCISEILGSTLYFRTVYRNSQVLIDAGNCPVAVTPCATVEAMRDVCTIQQVASKFPLATFLQECQADAYIGFPVLGNNGQVIAVTCLLDDRPREFTEQDQHLLRIIGQRLSAEVERKRVEEERKRAEQALLTNEIRLNEAQRIAKLGSWELNLATGELLWSEEIFRMFEIDPATFTPSYEAFLKAVHPDDRDKVNTAYLKSLKTGRPYHIVHRLLMTDGRIKYVEEQCETDFAADGAPLRSRGTVQDVTERKIAELALLGSEQRFRQLAESIRDVFYVLDVNSGRLSYVSPAYEAVWGRSLQVVYVENNYLLTGVHAEDLPKRNAAIKRQMKGEPTTCEYRVIRPNNTVCWVRDRSFAVVDEAGFIAQIVGVAEDITDMQEASIQFAMLREQLAHVARLGTIGEMASGLAHELNQPLTSLCLYANSALELLPAEGSDPLKDCLRRINDLALRSGEIVRHMRSFVTRKTSRRSTYRINVLIRDVLKLLEGDLKARGVLVVLHLGNHLPAMVVDGIQIQQILVNLIRNAIEAMPHDDDQACTLTITTEMFDDGVRVSISDTGTGVPAEIAANLFKPFNTTKMEGLGLGLAICRTLVEAHGGCIGAQPNLGRGTTFFFILPIHVEQ